MHESATSEILAFIRELSTFRFTPKPVAFVTTALPQLFTLLTQLGCKHLILIGVPDGIRTRVTAVKGRCPRPLDDGDAGGLGDAAGRQRDAQ